MTGADRAGPVTGGPFGDHAAVAVVGESLGDVAREALKIARVESRSRPVLLVDLLGQGSALDEMFGDDNPHGVSDAARYGVSLGHLARQVPNADSLFVVPGGAESPLADDVLSDHLWTSWSDQCRRAGALLVVAAPADTPAVERAIDQLEGVVMVGNATVPEIHVPVLGRIGIIRAPRADLIPEVPPPEPAPARIEENTEPEAGPSAVKRALIAVVILLSAGLLGTGIWRMNNQLRHRDPVEESASQPIVMPGEPVIIPATGSGALAAGAAPWSVELASVNTFNGAMARVRQALDSVPVLTFAATQPAGAAIWYKLRAGAFVSRADADSLLSVLRARGAIEPGAGKVVQAPLAWLLEENVLDEKVSVQLFLWRQQGLPAYALLNPQNGTSRIYFGAFENEAEARLLTPVLDSLNLYATLVTRIGSVR
jgi:hypothetical protein